MAEADARAYLEKLAEAKVTEGKSVIGYAVASAIKATAKQVLRKWDDG